jgi:hypothetical protein
MQVLLLRRHLNNAQYRDLAGDVICCLWSKRTECTMLVPVSWLAADEAWDCSLVVSQQSSQQRRHSGGIRRCQVGSVEALQGTTPKPTNNQN